MPLRRPELTCRPSDEDLRHCALGRGIAVGQDAQHLQSNRAVLGLDAKQSLKGPQGFHHENWEMRTNSCSTVEGVLLELGQLRRRAALQSAAKLPEAEPKPPVPVPAEGGLLERAPKHKGAQIAFKDKPSQVVREDDGKLQSKA